MIPNPNTKPAWLPASLILLGAAAGCAALACGRVPAQEWPRFLAGLTVVGADGTTLIEAMSNRAGTTMVLMLASVLIAVTGGLAVSFAALRAGCGLPWLAGFCGRLMAALPVVAITWTAVYWIVGRHGWPVESLLPHHPAPGRDTLELSLGRWLWWWLMPVWVLVLPLMGEVASQTLDLFAETRSPGLVHSLRARGLRRSAIHYRHELPAAWPGLLSIMKAMGMLALGYAIFVEDALGIPGWGSFFAAAIRAGDPRSIAGSVYAAGWMSAAWCLGIGLLRHVTTPPPMRHPDPAAPGAEASSKPVAVAVTSLLLVVACCAFGEHPALAAMGTLLSEYASPLVRDLRMVVAACGVTMMAAILCSRLPGARIIAGSLAWSPLLVWMLAFTALLRDPVPVWLAGGAVMAFGGAIEIRRRSRELNSSRSVEGSRAMGTGSFTIWRMHVLPVLFRVVLSWLLQSAGTLMVWIALSDSLKSPQPGTSATSLGLAMAAAKENVLGDLTPLLVPAALVTISALFFRQAARIVRPVPPPN